MAMTVYSCLSSYSNLDEKSVSTPGLTSAIAAFFSAEEILVKRVSLVLPAAIGGDNPELLTRCWATF